MKPPSVGGLCDGVTTMPSATPPERPLVVRKDGAGNHGRRREAVISLDEGFHLVGGEHLERNAFGGAGEGVGVLAHE